MGAGLTFYLKLWTFYTTLFHIGLELYHNANPDPYPNADPNPDPNPNSTVVVKYLEIEGCEVISCGVVR